MSELMRRLMSGRLSRSVHAPDVSLLEALHAKAVWHYASIILGPGLGLLAWFLSGRVPLDELPADGRQMLGIFVMTAWYWTTGAIPPFAAGVLAMGVSAFVLGVPAMERDDGGGSTIKSWHDFVAPAAAPVIVLMLGGFVLGQGVHKLGLDRLLARVLIRPFASGPRRLVLGVMLITGVMSMWMSNTATAVMMVTLVTPLTARADPAVRRALLLAVPAGANLGGMGTPIGTPPNAIVFGTLRAMEVDVTFTSWMVFAIPLVAIILLSAWGLLVLPIPRSAGTGSVRFDETPAEHGWRAVVVGVTFLLTVAMWISSPWTGIPVAATALVPIMAFTASGVLDRLDINRLDWDVLLLLAGGLALGKGMSDSGLAGWMLSQIPIEGIPTLAVLAILGGATLVLSTFMSNTAVANLITPIALGLAASASSELQPLQTGVVVALSASLAMGLPVSTPPNAIAFSTGAVRTIDFARFGSVIGVIGLALATATAVLL